MSSRPELFYLIFILFLRYCIRILLPTPSPPHCLVTMILLSIRSFSSETWEIIPTRRLPSARLFSAFNACSRDSSSREPNPSSTNMESSRIPPAEAWISSESPNARDRRCLEGFPTGQCLYASFRSVIVINDIQIKTCFFFLIFALFLAFQLVLAAAHGHKTEIGSSQDPVKICHLDIGFQLDLCLSVQFSICCIRKISDP